MAKKTIDDSNLGYLVSKAKASFWPKADVVQVSIDATPTVNSTNLVTSGGVYSAIPNVSGKEDTSNKVTSLSSLSTNTEYPAAKAVYDEVHPAVGITQPAGGFVPNIVYNLGTLAGDTTFTLATATDNTILNHWYWTFDTPSTAPTITWPVAITSWVGGSAPTVAASKHYEVSVIGGVAAFMEV